MKNIRHLILSSSLILALTFGLAGCSSNKNSTKSSSAKDRVTKVAKHKKSSSDKQNSNKASKNSKSSSVSSKDDDSTSSSSNTSSTNRQSAAATTSSKQTNSSTNTNQNSQRQLGLSDVAVWTDSKGVTHHVDSDGMDRQISPNSQGTTYDNWSGSLPSNAQIVHQN